MLSSVPREPKLCECGCGIPTKMITKRESAPANGYIAGENRRFVSGHNRTGQREKGVRQKCSLCQKEIWVTNSRIRLKKSGRKTAVFFCDDSCKNKYYKGSYTGAANPNWKGGRVNRSDGRPAVRLPGHPRANKEGYVLEYIPVAEKALGRHLKYFGTPWHSDNEVVHHLDGNPQNNTNSNLLICTNSYHKRLHVRMRRHLSGKGETCDS